MLDQLRDLVHWRDMCHVPRYFFRYVLPFGTITSSLDADNLVPGTGFTMYTSKGDCGVVDGALSCASGVSSGTFTVVDGLLAYDGQTTFYSSEVPSGSEQADIYTAEESYSVTFEWSAS